VSWLLQAGCIDALPIQLRGIDRLLTRAARIAHGIIPNPSRARKQAVDVGDSTTPAKIKSACVSHHDLKLDARAAKLELYKLE
jgi:hypothetical protein